ncbi:MAG: hypothetical protein LRY76_01110 [Alphaproteobacteria bacterium]|nr:hypothetical protein [Alphaproteobacteria bacterium]
MSKEQGTERTPAEESLLAAAEEFRTACRITLKSHRIYEHIHATWPKLTFTHEDLFLGGAHVPILPHKQGTPYYIYISDKEDLDLITAYYADIRDGLIAKGHKPEELLPIEIRMLPRNKIIPFDEHGILHIPRRAVSPGLNRYTPGTLYYWDTAFMIRGMVQDGMADLALDMLENLLYQAEHYGGPLNANSTVFLSHDKPRSQLPLLASKVRIMFENWRELQSPPGDKMEWLKRVLPILESHYQHWVTGAHLDPETGLSQFNTRHGQPGIEVLHAEAEHYAFAYSTLFDMWERQKDNPTPIAERPYQDRKDAYYIRQFLEMDHITGAPVPFEVRQSENIVRGLTPDFFRGDWAMRESGFDPSRRFGFLNVDIINHIPVCLNSFRCKMEEDIAALQKILGDQDKAAQWQTRAAETKAAMQQFLWDEALPQTQDDNPANETDPMHPAFRDLNINHALTREFNIGAFRRYNFAAAVFTPLWTGIATQAQADTIAQNIVPLLESPYGILASTRHTGCQWDAPLIWAPLQIMAVEGLERYGHNEIALRLAQTYVRAIEAEFERSGALYEKLEGKTGTAQTAPYIGSATGYHDNDTGFGWTITAYIELKIAAERLERKSTGRFWDWLLKPFA